MIYTNNLSKSYKSLRVLDDVSITCEAGEICGILGANGAGKTTLFKIILGLVTPDSGSFKIESQRIKPIGGIIEKPALYDYLSAHDNLKIFGSIQGAKVDNESIDDYLLKVGLPLNRKDRVRNFSMGMKQRLGIAIALLNNPQCLVLDEPFSGLDPMGIASLSTLIINLAEKENLAILISSHIVGEISRISHKLYVINKGKIIKSGASQALIKENTTSYTICAPNIKNSISLKNYQPIITGDCAKIVISSAEIAALIQNLHEENIHITSCTPEIDMVKLFEANPQ
ncbi:MAG: ABC transporter ATP-binding protein [Leeuwenhoekiella sp.]